MIEYVLSIMLALILLSVVNFSKRKEHGFIYYCSSVIAILPPAIIAGIRDYVIGTDIRHYVTTNFKAALEFSHLFDYTKYISGIKGDFIDAVNGTEFGYNVLVYTVSRFTDNPHWLLFWLQMLTSIFVLFGIYNFQKKLVISPVLGMLTYYLTLYPFTLNIMRQTLAAAICFYAISLLINNRIKTFAVFQIFAILIHGSAVIGLVLAGVYLLVPVNKFKNNRMVVYSVLILLSSLLFAKYLFMAVQLISLNVPLLNTFSTSFDVTGGYSSIKEILVYVLPDLVCTVVISIGAWFSGNSVMENHGKIISFLNCVILLSLMFNSLYLLQIVIPRLAIYMMMFRVVLYPVVIKNQLNYMRVPVAAIMVITEILTFIYILVSKNGEVFPYTSEILQQFIFNNF